MVGSDDSFQNGLFSGDIHHFSVGAVCVCVAEGTVFRQYTGQKRLEDVKWPHLLWGGPLLVINGVITLLVRSELSFDETDPMSELLRRASVLQPVLLKVLLALVDAHILKPDSPFENLSKRALIRLFFDNHPQAFNVARRILSEMTSEDIEKYESLSHKMDLITYSGEPMSENLQPSKKTGMQRIGRKRVTFDVEEDWSKDLEPTLYPVTLLSGLMHG